MEKEGVWDELSHLSITEEIDMGASGETAQ
ncbi:unnamed protein product, partial [Didymodactylos carnosus]